MEIPIPKLDEQNFLQIYEEAGKYMQQLLPQGADASYQDPGTVLLELFSLLKDMQQYHIDYLSDRQILKQIKLLGGDIKEARGALALLAFNFGEPDEDTCMTSKKVIDFSKGKTVHKKSEVMHKKTGFALPEGFPVYGGDLAFELMQTTLVSDNQLKKIIFTSGKKIVDLAEHHNDGKIRFYPFGWQPSAGHAIYMGFENDLFDHPIGAVYFGRKKAEPVWPDIMPLGKIKGEFLSQSCKLSGGYEAGYAGKCKSFYKPLAYFNDETKCLMQSGWIHMCADSPMMADKGPYEGEEWLYWVRLTLEESYFELPPALQVIGINMAVARQQETQSVTSVSRVQRSNTIKLKHHLAIYGCIEMQQETKNGWKVLDPSSFYRKVSKQKECVIVALQDEMRGKPVRAVCYSHAFASKRVAGRTTGTPGEKIRILPEEVKYYFLALQIEADIKPGYRQDWAEVPDFDASDADDHHFTTKNGFIMFGNGERGMIPPPGKVIVTGMQVTRGANGNVNQGEINRVQELFSGIQVQNIWRAEGGADRQSVEEAADEIRNDSKKLYKAVTASDYISLVTSIPGLPVECATVIFEDESPETIILVVKPKSSRRKPRLNRRYCQNILNYLEPYRILTTEIKLKEPVYFGLSMRIAVVTESGAVGEAAGIKKHIYHFFYVVDDRWRKTFGLSIRKGEIFGILGKIPTIKQIKDIQFSCPGAQMENGDVTLPPDGLFYLKNILIEIKIC